GGGTDARERRNEAAKARFARLHGYRGGNRGRRTAAPAVPQLARVVRRGARGRARRGYALDGNVGRSRVGGRGGSEAGAHRHRAVRQKNEHNGACSVNITIIGGGNMARALLGGLIARGQASDALAVVEIDAEARATVAARFGVATFAAIEPAAIGSADVIVIAVKPQNVRVVARELATLLTRQAGLPIAAGVRLS